MSKLFKEYGIPSAGTSWFCCGNEMFPRRKQSVPTLRTVGTEPWLIFECLTLFYF